MKRLRIKSRSRWSSSKSYQKAKCRKSELAWTKSGWRKLKKDLKLVAMILSWALLSIPVAPRTIQFHNKSTKKEEILFGQRMKNEK